MLSETDSTEKVEEAPVALTTYVVQKKVEVDYEPGEPFTAWQDIATVHVPSRTKRKTVIGKALEVAGIPPEAGARLEIRLLDEDSAGVVPLVGASPPPPPPPPAQDPEWVIAA